MIHRLATIGNIDDGKSTLMGRILLESENLYADQIVALDRASQDLAKGFRDPSLLVDGLRHERDHAMTVDVAYRYFSLSENRFIVADCPGHGEFLPNMVTGLSRCDTALMLVDITRGFQSLSKQHFVTALRIQCPQIIVVVNKMDLLHYEQRAFEDLKQEILEWKSQFKSQGRSTSEIHFVPISALKNEGIRTQSSQMPWYAGPCLWHFLLHRAEAPEWERLRLWTLWKSESGFIGRVVSGSISTGGPYLSLPNAKPVLITKLWSGDSCFDEVKSPRIVRFQTRERNLEAGDWLVDAEDKPGCEDQFRATIFFFEETARKQEKKFWIFLGGQKKTVSFTNVGDGTPFSASLELTVHDGPLVFDAYMKSRATGSFILVDPETKETVAAGIVEDGEE